MANPKTKRLNPNILSDDVEAFYALKGIAGYTPSNPAYTIANGSNAKTLMDGQQTTEAQAKATFDGARDNAVAAEWAFHDFMLGAKDQVKAQFGANSNELQGLGLKKKSEYKKPKAKAVGSDS
jgi:hypothetical protein